MAATATILHNTSNGGIYLDPHGSGSTFAPVLFAGIGGSIVSAMDFMII